MTAGDWIAIVSIAITTMIAAAGAFGYLLKENRATAKAFDTFRTAWTENIDSKLDKQKAELKNDFNTALAELKSDAKADRVASETRVEKLEALINSSNGKMLESLNKALDSFSLTCDAIEDKMGNMLETLLGKYVPREELDGKFQRIDDKQDQILEAVYSSGKTKPARKT